MEPSETNNPTPQTHHKGKSYDGLELLELGSIVLAVGGSIASAVLQNMAIASIPLSASLALNFYNRKRLIEGGDQTINAKLIQLAQYSKNKLEYLTEQIDEVQTSAVAKLNQTNEENKVYLEALAKKIQELQESTIVPLIMQSNSNQETLGTIAQDVNDIKKLTFDELLERGQLIQESNQNKTQISYLRDQLQEIQQLTIAELIEQSKAHQKNLENLATKLQDVQQVSVTELSQVSHLTSTLKQDTQQLQEYAKTIDHKHQELAEVVECLKEIETKSQAIKTEKKADESYFDLALNHERLGDYQSAINDYTEALRINPAHAKAYYHRGVLRNKIGDRQGALDDLRESAKHYFEIGDIPNYQKAKEVAKEIHNIGGKQEEKSPNVVVSGLFE